MPKLKAGTIVPTPAEDDVITTAALADLDAMPFKEAEWEQVKPQVRRGRPLGSGTKTQVTLRLDVEVVQTPASAPPQARTLACVEPSGAAAHKVRANFGTVAPHDNPTQPTTRNPDEIRDA